MCRGGGEVPDVLPDAGGMADQSPFVMEAFSALETARADYEKGRGGD